MHCIVPMRRKAICCGIDRLVDQNLCGIFRLITSQTHLPCWTIVFWPDHNILWSRKGGWWGGFPTSCDLLIRFFFAASPRSRRRSAAPVITTYSHALATESPFFTNNAISNDSRLQTTVYTRMFTTFRTCRTRERDASRVEVSDYRRMLVSPIIL